MNWFFEFLLERINLFRYVFTDTRNVGNLVCILSRSKNVVLFNLSLIWSDVSCKPLVGTVCFKLIKAD